MTIGVTEFDPSLEIGQMMEKVDKNLYEGKKSGKNKVVFKIWIWGRKQIDEEDQRGTYMYE